MRQRVDAVDQRVEVGGDQDPPPGMQGARISAVRIIGLKLVLPLA